MNYTNTRDYTGEYRISRSTLIFYKFRDPLHLLVGYAFCVDCLA